MSKNTTWTDRKRIWEWDPGMQQSVVVKYDIAHIAQCISANEVEPV